MRLAGRIMLFMIPLLLAMGFATTMLTGYFQIPRTTEFFTALQQFKGVETIKHLGESFASMDTSMDIAFGNVTDFASFFNAIGEFFNCVGMFFVILWDILTLPIQVLVWFFTWVFDPHFLHVGQAV